MKSNHAKKALMLGEFVAAVYDTWGKRRAKGFVRLAMKARLIEYREPQRFVIS